MGRVSTVCVSSASKVQDLVLSDHVTQLLPRRVGDRTRNAHARRTGFAHDADGRPLDSRAASDLRHIEEKPRGGASPFEPSISVSNFEDAELVRPSHEEPKADERGEHQEPGHSTRDAGRLTALATAKRAR